MMKYRVQLDMEISGDSEEDVLDWLKEHLGQLWDVPLHIDLIEEDEEQKGFLLGSGVNG